MENNNKKPLREIECNDLIGKWNNLGGMEVGIATCALLQPGSVHAKETSVKVIPTLLTLPENFPPV